MGYNSLLSLLVAHIVPDLAIGSSFKLSSFEMLPSFFEHLFTFWHHKLFQKNLFSLPQSWNYFISPRSPGSFHRRVGESYLETKEQVTKASLLTEVSLYVIKIDDKTFSFIPW